MKKTFLLFILINFSGIVNADITTLYDHQTLQNSLQKVPANLIYNFEMRILPKLPTKQRNALGNIKLYFPLYETEKIAHEPFCYYSEYDPFSEQNNRVIMSKMSLLFFSDLADAYSWLWSNGYALDAISNYIGMLKYRYQLAGSDPPGPYPQPLETLGISRNAVSNPIVKQLSVNIFTSGVTFVLLHEVGHIWHRHDRSSVSNEEEADRFALDTMRRVGIPPLGMTVFFLALVYWEPNRWDFESEKDYQKYLTTESTHPLTANRLLKIGKYINSNLEDFSRRVTISNRESDYASVVAGMQSTASQISQIAKKLADQKVQRAIAWSSRHATPETLVLRQKDEFPLSPIERPENTPYQGTFDGEMTEESEHWRVRFVLSRNGKMVSGKYAYAYGSAVGKIKGTIEGGVLYYHWKMGMMHGKGILKARSQSRQIDGTWGYEQSRDNGGRVTAHLSKH